MTTLILASGSEIRAKLLRNAGLKIDIQVAKVDEDAIKQSLLAEDTSPRDIADSLAEAKARRVSSGNAGKMVLGCDQVLDFDGRLISKSEDRARALDLLKAMRGRRHTLYSAAVIYEDARPVWRHIGQARLTMRDISDDYLEDYLVRNWGSVSGCVGHYKLEEEGVRLFTRMEGDYFSVLGLPLLEILSYLTLRGTVPS
jgi:septum formation protein